MSDTAGPEIVLVVDDSPVHAHVAAKIAERVLGVATVVAKDGREAVALLKAQRPLLVVTDLMMPNMDGLELTDHIVATYPGLPVVLMTAQGSEDVASQALRLGAAGYVPKSVLAEQLGPTLEKLASHARKDRRKFDLLAGLKYIQGELAMDNDETLVPLFIDYAVRSMIALRLIDDKRRLRVGVALEEALLNAILHGNLGVSSKLKEDGGDAFANKVAERKRDPRYNARRVHVTYRFTSTEAAFVLRDEGEGFDVASLPDPTDPENLVKPSGRGLLLIRTFVDEVRHNATGNEITLVVRRGP